MTLHIKDMKADALARELADLTGETLTQAVTTALEERLTRVKKRTGKTLADELNEIARRSAARPRRTNLSPDEIIGYDDWGLPR